MEKSEFVAFRATPEQRQKLEMLASATQTSLSWVLGMLVDRAELVTPALFMGAIAKPDAQQRKGQAQHA